jgi:hypothetical protein
MAEVLGLGMTHYPMLLGPDIHTAGLLRSTLGDPDIPGHRKDPANWTELRRGGRAGFGRSARIGEVP